MYIDIIFDIRDHSKFSFEKKKKKKKKKKKNEHFRNKIYAANFKTYNYAI